VAGEQVARPAKPCNAPTMGIIIRTDGATEWKYVFQGPKHSRARPSGQRHGRVPGDAWIPASAEARRARKARSRQGHSRRLRGQEIFFGKGQCGACHAAPYYTDNLTHDLKIERFFKPAMINGLWETGDGPIKTFLLRGIKDSPPYMHDGRLLTLDDTVEFFNLILGTKLTTNEKMDLVAFLRVL
jgi:hypothetical protein